jgi:hypothetical protein
VSEQNLEKKTPTPPAGPETKTGFEELVLKINRATNELIFTDPKTGKETKIKTKFIEEEEEPAFELKPPLTVDEFRQVLERLNKLGISWSTDIPPTPVFQTGWKIDEEFWKEYFAIQKEFPSFPYELNKVIFHAFLHPVSDKEIDKKVQLISNLLTQEYRSEFFFKYAIKVSYFEDIDWEVVVKAYEKGAERMPRIAYALLSLILRNPVNTTLSLEEAANAHREPQFITVAVNESLLDKLMSRLIEIKTALEKAQAATHSLVEHIPGKEESVDEPSAS